MQVLYILHSTLQDSTGTPALCSPSATAGFLVLFCQFALKMPIHTPKMGLSGIWPPKCEIVSSGFINVTSLHRKTSYDAQIVEIGQMVAEISTFSIFTARPMLCAVCAMAVCLCLSQVGVLLKRLHVG